MIPLACRTGVVYVVWFTARVILLFGRTLLRGALVPRSFSTPPGRSWLPGDYRLCWFGGPGWLDCRVDSVCSLHTLPSPFRSAVRCMPTTHMPVVLYRYRLFLYCRSSTVILRLF